MITLHDLKHWQSFLDTINTQSLVPQHVLAQALSSERLHNALNHISTSNENVSYYHQNALSLRYINDAWAWAQALQMKKSSPVMIELCSGSSLVIDLALAFLKYKNTFYSIDYNNWESPEAKDIVTLYTKKFLSLDVITQTQDIPQADVIMLNHSIDDLFIGLWDCKYQVGYFSSMTNPELVNSSWKKAMQTADEFYPILSNFITQLADRINPDGLLIIRDYPSSYETWQQDINRINFTRNLTTKLISEAVHKGIFSPVSLEFEQKPYASTFFILLRQ